MEQELQELRAFKSAWLIAMKNGNDSWQRNKILQLIEENDVLKAEIKMLKERK